MLILIFYILLLLALIAGNKLVISGATYGLMLWYESVVPLLMPFMLISGLIALRLRTLPKSVQQRYAILITLLTGLLCGYPLGAKNASEFIKNDFYTAKTGQALLALCNNCSPMFLLGYIITKLLNGRISFAFALVVIYTPYVTHMLIRYIAGKVISYIKLNIRLKSKSETNKRSAGTKPDIVMSTIIQITYVGFYIMICSIISEFILSIPSVGVIKVLAAAACEITRGSALLIERPITDTTHTIAIVLALTSFGGISAILQTAQAIRGSGLSILRYIIEKTICGISTYGLVILLFNIWH